MPRGGVPSIRCRRRNFNRNSGLKTQRRPCGGARSPASSLRAKAGPRQHGTSCLTPISRRRDSSNGVRRPDRRHRRELHRSCSAYRPHPIDCHSPGEAVRHGRQPRSDHTGQTEQGHLRSRRSHTIEGIHRLSPERSAKLTNTAEPTY